MNRPVEWNSKLPDGGKRRVRVSFFSGKLKWQFQLDGEPWDYDSPPTMEDWETLKADIYNRYQRRRATQKEWDLTQKLYREAQRFYQQTP